MIEEIGKEKEYLEKEGEVIDRDGEEKEQIDIGGKTRKEVLVRRERTGSLGTLEIWNKRKREEGMEEEKAFARSKIVARSPIKRR